MLSLTFFSWTEIKSRQIRERRSVLLTHSACLSGVLNAHSEARSSNLVSNNSEPIILQSCTFKIEKINKDGLLITLE